ncbi:unnamed protein product [Acanthoscelides obtectus]|uniref:Uncharacterized protein n=1 Tax=Acanthoscelides obtectus TaxID=200917 RepID=A0A9P0QDZ9_ACAOB|nr:unnamed protein product [Acanthoscelides obtectus]CAK1636193.1 hypothetical protein AOBTE_LOCUS9779 [Acanthoscelides obtectus]
MENDAGRYGRRMTFKTPLLPEARLEWETENSCLYNKVQQTEYPPIFARQSWTKGVLEKDMQMYFKPSETIALLLILIIFRIVLSLDPKVNVGNTKHERS